MTRRFLLPTLLLHLGIIFRVIVHQAYCENCHWLWSLSKKRVPAPAKARAASAISLEWQRWADRSSPGIFTRHVRYEWMQFRM